MDTADVVNEVPTPAPTATRRRRLTEAQAIVIASVISGVVGIGITLMATQGGSRLGETASAAVASDVLTVDSLRTNDVNLIDAQAQGSFINGHLATQALPSGKQIFAAARQKVNDKDKGNLGTNPVSFFQCSVDVAAKSFDCGQPWLGTPGIPGEYFVYVGLADQNTSGTIIDALEDQAKSSDDKNWSHVAPSGFDVLPGILVARR